MNNQRQVEKKFSAGRSQIMLANPTTSMNRYKRPNSQPLDNEATATASATNEKGPRRALHNTKCAHSEAEWPLTCGNTVPEVGLEPGANP